VRRIPRPRVAVLAAALALAGTTLTAVGIAQPHSARVRQADPGAPAGVRESVPTPGLPPAPLPAPTPARSLPIRLDIPRIRVHTDLARLGLNPDGTVEVPPLRSDAPAGWYENSVIPGETGAAVILGHVDSARDGPAVFYLLGTLRTGDRISVLRADGTTARFTVTGVARYPKSKFPTSLVYGPTGYPALRLVTCGGSFDRVHRSYRDNIIVSAR
jgi:hypothetical protein